VWCVILCDVYFCVLCIVVPVLPGKNTFSVQLNNNNNNNKFEQILYIKKQFDVFCSKNFSKM
jgi:hypothetical protein